MKSLEQLEREPWFQVLSPEVKAQYAQKATTETARHSTCHQIRILHEALTRFMHNDMTAEEAVKLLRGA